MSRVLYLDGFSGIAGDMFLGACLDAGLPLDDLRAALGSLAVSGYTIGTEPVLRAGVSATRFVVHEEGGAGARDHSHEPAPGHAHGHAHPHEPGDSHAAHGHAHRTLAEILDRVGSSALSPVGRERAAGMFRRLAEAEARIHGMSVDQVHLHEVGALDSIIDIVGAVFAMEWIGADRVVCSPLNVGGGMVSTEHGLFPVPAPATLALLGDAPIYGGHVQKELVTPTGALIATTWSDTFGPVPAMSLEAVGYGAGSRDNPGTPNVLRILIGREASRPAAERVTVIECEIDDMSPQLFGAAMERLYAAGALEVYFTAVQMKKNRPGTLLTVVAAPERRAPLADVIFRETTTIGLRHHEVEREVLHREIITVDTPFGAVRVKLSSRDGRVVTATPEFEDCAALARSRGVPVKDIQALALQAYGALAGPRVSAP